MKSEKETGTSVGRAACRACKAHAGALAGLFGGQLLLRIAALAPLYLIPEYIALPDAVGWILTALSSCWPCFRSGFMWASG